MPTNFRVRSTCENFLTF